MQTCEAKIHARSDVWRNEWEMRYLARTSKKQLIVLEIIVSR